MERQEIETPAHINAIESLFKTYYNPESDGRSFFAPSEDLNELIESAFFKATEGAGIIFGCILATLSKQYFDLKAKGKSDAK